MVDPDLGLVTASRSMTQWAARYLVALLMVAVFFTGSVPAALFLILIAEIINLWRPTPALGPASYSAPTPAGLRTPIRVLRWYEMASGCWSLAVVSVLATVIVGIMIIAMGLHPLAPANFVVAGLFAVWLVSRPLWFPRLKKQLAQSLQGVEKELSGAAPTLSIGADGIDIEVKVTTIGAIPPGATRPAWIFHVTFAEVEEVRTLSPGDAQAYWQSLEQYDPSLVAKGSLELYQYVRGQLARPSIYQYLAGGTHVLIRGAGVLYLVAWADQSGPAAVAAWNGWRAAHGASAGPPA